MLQLPSDLTRSRRGRVFERLLDAMYRFRREPASIEALARGLAPDEALGALWLAGRLQMPLLQKVLAGRLHEATASANGAGAR